MTQCHKAMRLFYSWHFALLCDSDRKSQEEGIARMIFNNGPTAESNQHCSGFLHITIVKPYLKKKTMSKRDFFLTSTLKKGAVKSESLQAIWFSYLILDWHNNLPAFSCYMLQPHQQYSMFKVKICSTTHSLYLFDLVLFKLFFFSYISSQKKCLVLIHWSLLDVHVSCTEEYNLTKRCSCIYPAGDVGVTLMACLAHLSHHTSFPHLDL